jgi:hypothetical protein
MKQVLDSNVTLHRPDSAATGKLPLLAGWRVHDMRAQVLAVISRRAAWSAGKPKRATSHG